MGYTAGEFFQVIYKRCTKGQVEFRSLPSLRRRFVSLSNLQTLSPFSKTDNHYFGVGTRDGSGGGKNNLVETPTLWLDIDFKETPKDLFERKLADFPLKPSILVESGGGYHVYWLLKNPLLRMIFQRSKTIYAVLLPILVGIQGQRTQAGFCVFLEP